MDKAALAGPLHDPLRGPLTAADVARIEQGIDELLTRLTSAGEVRRRVLALDLRDKIKFYITLVKRREAESGNPFGSAESDVLRELLAHVEAYYRHLE